MSFKSALVHIIALSGLVFVAMGQQCTSGPCCDTSTQTYRPNGFVCEDTLPEEVCGLPARCSGSSSICPAKTPRGNWPPYQCDPSYPGPCAYSPFCDGVSLTCPPHPVAPEGTPCTSGEDLCEQYGKCDGISYTGCGPVTLKPYGAQCFWPGAGAPCLYPSYCTGFNPGCPEPEFRPNTHLCHASAASPTCDVDRYCTGNSESCPVAYRPNGHVCITGGACAANSVCSGSSTTCPPQAFYSGNVCNSASTPCEGNAYCPGNSVNCPAKPLLGNTQRCAVSSGPCEVDAYCTGTSSTCPQKQLLGSNIPCNTATDDCEAPAYCTGTAAGCPAKPFLPSSTVCNAAIQPCETDAHCTGSGASCPTKPLRDSSHRCDASTTACELDSYCTGESNSCPTKALQPLGYSCADASGSCYDSSTCDGTTSVCHLGSQFPEGTPCGTNQLCEPASNHTCDIDGHCEHHACTSCPSGRYGSDCSCSAPPVGQVTPVCVDGTWILTGVVTTLYLPGGSSGVVIEGTLDIPANASIEFEGIPDGGLVVKGCTDIKGPILLTLSPEELEYLEGGGLLIEYEVQKDPEAEPCDYNKTVTATVSVTVSGEDPCKKYTATTSQSQSGLGVLFSVDETGCKSKPKSNTRWIALGASLGGAAVLAAAGTIGWSLHRANKFKPLGGD